MAKITFILPDETEQVVEAENGISILEVAKRELLPLEGACEGSLACATCHIIIEDEGFFAKSGELTEDEEDMLDLAYGLTPTSRLGCQVIVSDELNNARIRLLSTRY